MEKWKWVAERFNAKLHFSQKRMTQPWITRHMKEIQAEIAD